jgi:hypothetical protein
MRRARGQLAKLASVAREKRRWLSKIYLLRLRVTITQGRQSDVLSFSESIETEIDIYL